MMNLEKIAKVLVLAVPMVILAGCGSSSKDESNDSGIDISTGREGSLSSSQRDMLERLQSVNTVYFDFDRYDIKPEYINALDAHAAFLRTNTAMTITVEGHADERGTPEYNIALGERRANSVKQYLQGRGVPANQIYVVSYGKEKPAAYGHNESAYAKNRRAVIVY